MIQCPHCNLALEPHIERDVEIDICHGCRGVWLDRGELEILSNGEAFAPHVEASQDLGHLRCPRCDTERFAAIQMEEGTLAQCLDCRGLFVAGETMERVSAVRTRRYPGHAPKDLADQA